MRIRLLNCLAGAVLKHGPKLLFSWAPGGEVIYDIAAETWTAFRKNDEPDAARLEVEALAQASAEQVREAIAQAVKEAEGKVGAPVKITGFVRYALGEGIERQETDFAAEVAAVSGQK